MSNNRGRVKTNSIMSHKSLEYSEVQAETYFLILKTQESGGEAWTYHLSQAENKEAQDINCPESHRFKARAGLNSGTALLCPITPPLYCSAPVTTSLLNSTTTLGLTPKSHNPCSMLRLQALDDTLRLSP